MSHSPGDGGWRLRHLPVLLAVSAVLLLGAAGIGWLARGGAGAAGAVAGVAIVTASYTLSTLVIAWADSVHPQLVLPFGLTMYATKIGVIGVVMASVAATDWAGLVPLGFGVVAGVIGWTATQVWWFIKVHARQQPGLKQRPE
jgi:hypothetical protein